MIKRITPLIGIVLIATAGFMWVNRGPQESDFKTDVEPIPIDDIRRRPSIPEMPEEEKPLPSSINLDVPFFPQAPDGDWSLPWKEACEEASITLAHYYLTGEPLDKETFKKEVLSLTEWQIPKFGHYIDTGIEQTAEMLEGFFGRDSYKIIDDPTPEQIKRELADGHPVVAPFAGRQLGNPFYSGLGPYYHMMVIVGYDDKGNFITNDVGTRRGHDFVYSIETIMSAMNDWGTLDINFGSKRVLVLQ